MGWEYVRDCAQLAHEAGLRNLLVSNGHASYAVIGELAPLIDAANIDLKAFNPSFYTMCGGSLMLPKRTLEQMCVIIGNLVDRDAASAADTSELDRYVDGAQVSPWAKNYVAWASKVGLFSGSVEQDGLHVRGGESIMRERVAGVLSNAFKSGILK